ncbi:hypothetical protein ABK040_015498 [Willaertia magna]
MMNEQQIFIQDQLELQVDSLNELKYTKTLSDDEIIKIVQKRTDYLYLFSSNLPKEDLLLSYLQHLSYELNLIELVQLRLKTNDLKLDNFNIHLQFLYQQFKNGLTKFSTNIYLMKSFLDFCIKFQLKPHDVFDLILSKYSNQVQIWLLYAKFEFEFNENIDNSIVLLKKEEEEDANMKDEEENEKILAKDFYPEMINLILNFLLKNFRHSEKYIYEIFIFKWKYFNNIGNEGYNNLINEMENICDRVCHTSEMYLYLILLIFKIFKENRDVKVLNKLNLIFTKINNSGLLTCKIVYIYCNYLLSYNNKNEKIVINILKQLHLIKIENDDNYLVECLNLLLKLNKYQLSTVEFCNTLIEKLNIDLRINFYKKLFNDKEVIQLLKNNERLFIQAIKLTKNSYEMKKVYFNLFKEKKNLNELITFILSLAPNTSQIYQTIIKYLLTFKDKYDYLLTNLFEQQVNENKQDWKVYIQYMNYLKSKEKFKAIPSVYSKAMNALSGMKEELDQFVTSYNKYIK